MPVRVGTMRGWLAAVHVNDVFLMMAVDTGAALTMLNKDIFKKYFKKTKLTKSKDQFVTATGDPMKAKGQFRADVQLGPVTIAGLKISVADVLGDGLLGMDFLLAADAWVGARKGELHMKVGETTVICQTASQAFEDIRD